MSGTYKSKAELVAIYRLEFYRKQKHWKFCSDVRREQPDNRDKASMKNSLNETYDVDLTDVGEAGDGGEGGDPGGSQSELNKAFVDSGPDEQSPPPESRPNTPQSWLEHDPNQTQDTSPTHPDRIPTPPPYPPPKQLPRDIPEVWPQPVTWESHQYNRDNQDLRDKCPELNRSYTKVDWMDSEKIYPEEMYPEKYSGLKDWQEEWQPQPWAECGATWGEPVWGETGWPEVGGELPELDRGAGGGGEDTWPLMGWDVPGVTDAVWSDDVARELAALAAPLQPPGPADTSADCSPDTSCDSAVVLFTRGAHCAPHSSELDLHAQLDATDAASAPRIA
ncbi:uncharacterized protein LOC126378602 [Pectinophora gossypiella]|uniref:uncharacterized protein LOC126378602 n=1 Tax=Pectinophora gossypiella TaxID=13191 RepID=UPI00214E2FC7|nr:uncharacterized protein LOC126378602 [Pectinophora gossypiella]